MGLASVVWVISEAAWVWVVWCDAMRTWVWGS